MVEAEKGVSTIFEIFPHAVLQAGWEPANKFLPEDWKRFLLVLKDNIFTSPIMAVSNDYAELHDRKQSSKSLEYAKCT